MFPWWEIGKVVFQTIYQVVVHEYGIFWLVVLIIGIQYRRMAGMERRLYGREKTPVIKQTLVATAYGIAGGVIGSMAMMVLGLSIAGTGLQYVWPLAILLMMINARFMCFAYAGGLVSLSSLIFGVPRVEVPQLIALVAVLHVIESILIRLSGHLAPLPVFVKDGQGRIVGGFNLQKFWPLPLAVISVAFVPDLSAVPQISMPDWWPLLKTTLQPPPGQEMLYVAVPVLAALGYGDIAITTLPKVKSRISARYLAAYSFLLLALAVGSSSLPWLQWLAALFAPLGHEAVIWLGLRQERRGMAVFDHPPAGLRVLDVYPDSPAGRMGLETGEIIMAINGFPVNTIAQFGEALAMSHGLLFVETRFNGEEKMRRGSFYPERDGTFGVILVPDDPSAGYLEMRTISPLQYFWEKIRRRR